MGITQIKAYVTAVLTGLFPNLGTLKKLTTIKNSLTFNGKQVMLSPTGTIIHVLSTQNPPHGWVECNGQELLINSYRNLAEYIKAQCGSYDFYGGDGETTFAVPYISIYSDTNIKILIKA